jgi:hypothetical protein
MPIRLREGSFEGSGDQQQRHRSRPWLDAEGEHREEQRDRRGQGANAD